MNRSHAAMAAALATAALAGCGDSNKQLSYGDFISKANKICVDGNAELAKVKGAEEAGKVLDKYLGKFEDLSPPDKLEPDYDEFVSITRQQVNKLEVGDFDGANALGPKSDEVAARMGTRDCISSG
jgi:hypothetical protein